MGMPDPSRSRLQVRNSVPARAKDSRINNSVGETVMRNHRLYVCILTAVAGLVLISSSAWAQGRGGRGRGAAPPSAPAPHWPDGRVNLDAAPGQKGFWNVMQGNVFGRNG